MKKILALFMASVMVFGMSMAAFAANPIKGIDTKNFKAQLKKNGENGLILLDKKAIKADQLEDLSISPGNEIKIYLTADMFVDSAGKTVATQDKTPEYVTRNQIRAGKITLRRATSSGSKAFSSVSLKYDSKGAYIGVVFVDSYASTKPLDFSTKLYLYVNNKRVNETLIAITGSLGTESEGIYSDMDYIDLSDGSIGEAMEYIPKIEINMGNGVSVVTSISRGKQVYATCSAKVSSADSRIMSKYPDIAEVLTLTTQNVRKTGKPVYIDVDFTLYVFGADGKYLGTTDQMLAYSSKYYLSDRKYASLTVK